MQKMMSMQQEMMKNPAMMQQAQQMMSNPAMAQQAAAQMKNMSAEDLKKQVDASVNRPATHGCCGAATRRASLRHGPAQGIVNVCGYRSGRCRGGGRKREGVGQ